MMNYLILVGASALSLRPHHALTQHHSRVDDKMKTHAMVMVGGCLLNPGAGMDASKHSVSIFKDGFWFVDCMMDSMEKDADWHNEQTRGAEYSKNNELTNVTIVRYTDRVDKEVQQKMTPRVCFNFCRSVPEMGFFGLAYGRECYCTPYFHRTTGDGVCDAQCEGDAASTCGNTNGMANVYEMHSCGAGDTVDMARTDVSKADQVIVYGKSLSVDGTTKLEGIDRQYDHVTDAKRTKLQTAAKNLAAYVRDVDTEVSSCEEQSDALKGVLDGVADDTTVASEVLDIESKQRELNACREALEKAIKGLQAELGMRAVGKVMEFDGSKYASAPAPAPTPAPTEPAPPADTSSPLVKAAVDDGVISQEEADILEPFLSEAVTSLVHISATVKKVSKIGVTPEELWARVGDQVLKSGLDAGVINSEEAEGYVAKVGGCGGCQDASIYYYYMHFDVDTSSFGYGKCDGTIAPHFTYWYEDGDAWNLGSLSYTKDDSTRVYQVEYYYYDWTVPVKMECGEDKGSFGGEHPFEDNENWAWYYFEGIEVDGKDSTEYGGYKLSMPCACPLE